MTTNAPATVKRSLTGVKPTGTPHLGNYLGAIAPALELAESYSAYYFIADYHALTTVRDSETIRNQTYDVAATWLALGLDPERVVFYRQSDLPEIPELTWILSCFTAKGLLNRAHAYKSSVDANVEAGNDPDDGVNHGLFTYPVLMAADILACRTHYVPVGGDQRQHLEITRDIANAFNHTYNKEVFTVPEAVINDQVMTIPGVDGRKMSKSYDNVIPIFAPSKPLRKRVMRIVTNSQTPEEPKDPDSDNIYNIYRYFASEDEIASVRQQYTDGGLAYGKMKQALFERLEETFTDARERYNELMNDPAQIDAILARGAQQARDIASPLLDEVRRTVGIKR